MQRGYLQQRAIPALTSKSRRVVTYSSITRRWTLNIRGFFSKWVKSVMAATVKWNYMWGGKNQTLKKGRKRDKGERFEIPSWFLNKINQHFEYLQCVLGLQKWGLVFLIPALKFKVKSKYAHRSSVSRIPTIIHFILDSIWTLFQPTFT